MKIIKFSGGFSFVFFWFITLTYAQKPQPKIIDTFEINTGKIVLFDDNSWAFLEEITDSTRKDEKNEFNATWLYKQEKKNIVISENNTKKNSEKKSNTKKAQGEKGVYITIKKGDNLYNLAKRNRTTVEKICYLNGIEEDTKLKIGQKLRVK